MRTHPALEVLRGDPAPQHEAALALEAARRDWQARAEVRPWLDQLTSYGAGAALDSLPLLAASATCGQAARDLVDPLVRLLCDTLACHPFGLVPLRHQVGGDLVVLELTRTGRAAVTLLVYRPRAESAAQTVSFTSGDRHEVCLGGQGDAVRVESMAARPGGVELRRDAMSVSRGWTTRFDNACEAKIVTAVRAPLVIMRLQRDLVDPLPAREYRLDDGMQVHESAADRRDSRRELALALLGSMGRRDALPSMVEAARNGPAHVRWEAVRQALGLDTGTGFGLLCDIARSPDDPLASAAAALRAQLLEAYPQLAQVKGAVPCPA